MATKKKKLVKVTKRNYVTHTDIHARHIIKHTRNGKLRKVNHAFEKRLKGKEDLEKQKIEDSKNSKLRGWQKDALSNLSNIKHITPYEINTGKTT